MFPDSRLDWPAITSPALHQLAIWNIVVAELAVTALCLWGGVRFLLAARATATRFSAANGHFGVAYE